MSISELNSSESMALMELEQRALIGPEECRSIIVDTHRNFSEGKAVDQVVFDRASDALKRLEEEETEYRNRHLGQSSPHKKELVQLKTLVDEMHGKCQQLTRRDGMLFSSFFRRSEDKFFIDSEGVRYLYPDDSNLLAIAFKNGCGEVFEGCGVRKHQILRNPETNQKWPSTILVLSKPRNQVSFENHQVPSGFFSSWCNWGLQSIFDYKEKYRRLAERQQMVLEQIQGQLYSEMRRRDYSSVHLITKNEVFESYGMPRKDRGFEKTGVFVMFYKKCEEGPTFETVETAGVSQERHENRVDDDVSEQSRLVDAPLAASPTLGSAKIHGSVSPTNCKCSIIDRIKQVIKNTFESIRWVLSCAVLRVQRVFASLITSRGGLWCPR